MTGKNKELGERIRAYRMGAGLSPEEAAARLQISRAALYKYERTGVVKLATVERFAALVGVSTLSLLGGDIEYFDNPISFFERKRQIERRATQIVSYVEPVSFLLTSPDYVKHLRQMIVEGLPKNFIGKKTMLQQVDAVMTILSDRQDSARERNANVTSIISAVQIARFLRTGMIGTYDLPPRVREERCLLARQEIERLAAMVEKEPIGIQIGIVEEILPHQTFELLRQPGDTVVAVSPFRLGEFPNVSMGVASITATSEAVALYENLSEKLWSRACRGADGANLLRRIIQKISPAAKPSFQVIGKKK